MPHFSIVTKIFTTQRLTRGKSVLWLFDILAHVGGIHSKLENYGFHKQNFDLILYILQSNRMFFWWELCKLPPEHWYFGWQFETSKLQPARASCSVHLVPRDRTRWDFPKCFKCYFNTLKTGLRVFAWMSHWATTKISSIAWEKPYGFWRRLRPANRNIIKRSFFANIYQCWRELQFTCLPAKLLGTLRLVDQTFTDEFTWR